MFLPKALYFASVLVAAVSSLVGGQRSWLKGSWSLGFLQLLFVWLLGTRCAKLLVQNWKHLPIPAAADGTTFAILAALRSSLNGFGGPLSAALLLAYRHWASVSTGEQFLSIQLLRLIGPTPDGLASFLPALRDASLLVLLHRLLKAGQTAGELMYSSRILSTQRRELWQNTRERRVIASLLTGTLQQRSGEESEVSAPEPLDEQAPLAFERACAELITAGSPGSDVWLSMVKLSEEPTEDSDSSASEEHSPTRRGQADLLRQEGIICEPKMVAKGAAALFKRLVPEGRLSYATLCSKLQDATESERFWQLLEALDVPANFKKPRPHRALSRANTAPLDEATPKSHGKLAHTKSSGHIEISVGEDAFVQLVVSTYKDAARLVSNVGEHSAIFALFCSVLRLCRVLLVSMAALGRFAPTSLMQTLSWLISSVLLAVSFAWGPVLLDVMQSLVLLLHVCPFDTGDRIVFRGQILTVAHIKLLNTVFRDVYDEEIYIRNAALYAGDGIINLRRSGPAYVAITLMIPLTFARKEIFKALTVAARNYVMSHPETWRDPVTCGFYPTQQGSGGVEVHMESFPSQALRWRVGLSHQLSKLHSGQVRSDASQFLTELIEEAVKLGIEWPVGQEHGTVEEPA
ncbi:unnamed protein product [Durusdinium trenchii]|uniref:Mechanosensitive ion channel MscS domain-containing protein n=1 Tax=Durusdinium trenchii TaxID=1381693 RepID=A0ABP0MK04_9DINO